MSHSEPTLYERLGGEAAIARLIDRFYDRVVADPELDPFFQNTSMDKLRRMQREFFATALGGPQNYSGLSLAQAHQGRGINVHHFNRFAQHLLETLREFDLSEDDIHAVIARISVHVDEITGQGGFQG